jgi:hypothetical protein
MSATVSNKVRIEFYFLSNNSFDKQAFIKRDTLITNPGSSLLLSQANF